MDFFKDAKTLNDVYETKINIPDEIPNEMPKYSMDIMEMLQSMDKEEILTSQNKLNSYYDENFYGSSKELCLKNAYNDAGMWAFVSWRWVNPLSHWIGKRKVLEVMAGRGWLTHALQLKGVGAHATDDFSWAEARGWEKPLTEVDKLDAVTAIDVYGKHCDIVIMAWPYMDDTAFHVLEEMHRVNPKLLLVYIGEEDGGCTASSAFFDHFEQIEDEWFDKVASQYQRWYGMRDQLMLGRYKHGANN